MKAGTEELAKFHDVVDALGIDPCFVGGLLDFIWKFAAKNCPRGDIGRFSNKSIAKRIGYTGDADRLIDVLTEFKWLDPAEGDARLVVHDWSDHAEDSVHRKLARARQWFWDGSPPKLTRLTGHEKRDAEKYYENSTCDDVIQRAYQERTKCTPPLPSLALPSLALPLPDHASAGAESGFSKDSIVTEDTLADPDALDRWIDHDATRSDAIVETPSPSANFRTHAHAAAAKARTAHGIRKRPEFFKWLVRGRRWPYLRIADEEFAAALQREFRGKRVAGAGVLDFLDPNFGAVPGGAP